jgi:hypothetical protein
MRTAALLIAVALGACGTDAPSCPNDQPSACPMPMPSYANDVAPVLTKYCVDCHSPTGQAPDRPLQTYAEVYARRTSVLSFTATCQMPPPEFPQPTEPERVALLGWLTCGAPNN